MTTALLKASTFLAMPSDGSTGAPVTTSARNIEVSGAPDFSDSFDTIERNVVRQAFSTYSPLRGLETTSASITLELHGSGRYDQAPESSLLYKSAFGGLYGPDAGETWELVDDALSTTTTSAYVTGDYTTVAATSPVLYTLDVAVTSSADFGVGFPVRFHASGTIKTIGFITAIVDSTHITIRTQNAAAITSGDTVDSGYLYALRNLDDTQILDTPEVNAHYFRGDITKEAWSGLLATAMEVDFSTGQVCLPAFSFEGAEVGYATGTYASGDYTGINTTFDSESTSPLVVQLADIYMQNQDDDSYMQECVSNIQFSLANTVYKKQCIASLGIGEVLRTSRACTGSMNLFYTGKDFQDAFRAETQYTLQAVFNYAASLDASGDKVFGTSAGNIVAVSVPQLKFSEVNTTESDGIFKYENSFSCEPTGSGDNEIYMAFL